MGAYGAGNNQSCGAHHGQYDSKGKAIGVGPRLEEEREHQREYSKTDQQSRCDLGAR